MCFKELNPRRRIYVEIPKPSRVALKCSQNLTEGFDIILATPERALASQHRPDAAGLISILVLSLPGRVLVELPIVAVCKRYCKHATDKNVTDAL
jgi:hypothetical protein